MPHGMGRLVGVWGFDRLHGAHGQALATEKGRSSLDTTGSAFARHRQTPIKPIWKDPELFELRRTALKKGLRFYHREPVEAPCPLVALHRQMKLDDPPQRPRSSSLPTGTGRGVRQAGAHESGREQLLGCI